MNETIESITEHHERIRSYSHMIEMTVIVLVSLVSLYGSYLVIN
ncbi:hypothetical protein [Sulfurimonas aquatica]|nr:hypothetical protein [Sulfurimonas aquatica]